MDREKHIDESWKEAAEQQKENLENLPGQDEPTIHYNEPIKQEDESVSPEQAFKAEGAESNDQAQAGDPGIDFLNYISSLAFQAMVFMGIVPNPMTNAMEKNLDQAKMLIDTLAMLREKTRGNLNQQELDLMNTSIYELQMKYVELSSQPPEESNEGGANG